MGQTLNDGSSTKGDGMTREEYFIVMAIAAAFGGAMYLLYDILLGGFGVI